MEIDPYDPRSTPVKHTALARFNHEGANIRVADDGRVVAYLGDDEKFEYIYKFVSDEKMKPATASWPAGTTCRCWTRGRCMSRSQRGQLRRTERSGHVLRRL